jgi:tripartite-type tricarboxylate transporter receptor subunit TctC
LFARDRRLGRRTLLGGAAAVALGGALGAVPARATSHAVRLLCGFGAGNPTDLCATLIGEAFAGALDQPVELDYAIGDAGRAAARETIDNEPDGHTLLIAEVLNLVLQDPQGELLQGLQPVAKLTRGLSTAIVASAVSGIDSWDKLLTAARSRSLRAATTGSRSTVGMALGLVEERARLSFDVSEVASTRDALDLLRTRRVDIAALDTRSALLNNDRPGDRNSSKLAVIATSGARRSPDLPRVPTFAEIFADPKIAYTISYAVFTSARVAPPVVERLTAALLRIREDRQVETQARFARLPLQIDGPDVVRETIARDRRVASALPKV